MGTLVPSMGGAAGKTLVFKGHGDLSTGSIAYTGASGVIRISCRTTVGSNRLTLVADGVTISMYPSNNVNVEYRPLVICSARTGGSFGYPSECVFEIPFGNSISASQSESANDIWLYALWLYE